jgi:hypothetical protein
MDMTPGESLSWPADRELTAPGPPLSGERPIGGDRPLCFLHIAKTGGTSVTDAIARLYPPDRVFTDRGNLSVGYLEGLGERLAGRVFLAGHAHTGVAEFLSGRADLITVLRRPADQAVSNYLHVLSDPGNRQHPEAIRGSFSDFLRRNDHQIDYQLGALCVALTSDPARGHELRTRDLDPVLRFLDSLPFVGVMERAEACGEVLSRILPDSPPLRLPCLNAAVYRGISARTLDRLHREYEMLRGDPQLAPVFDREARLHARAAAALDRLEQRLTPPDRRPRRDALEDGAVNASRFSTRRGEIAGSAIVCRLGDAKEHLVHGPYDRLPAGCYAVEFRFALQETTPSARGRILIEASSNGVTSLRRRWLAPAAQARTLHFVNDHASNILEFRVRSRGFAEGQLVFEGVSVRPSTIWQAWPSALYRPLSRLLRGLVRRVRPSGPSETEAAIPIEARARSRAAQPTLT